MVFWLNRSRGTAWFDGIRLTEGDAVKERVYARDYSKALILVKPNCSGIFDSSTVTIHSLNGSYRFPKSDGSLVEYISKIALRNSEAVILIK